MRVVYVLDKLPDVSGPDLEEAGRYTLPSRKIDILEMSNTLLLVGNDFVGSIAIMIENRIIYFVFYIFNKYICIGTRNVEST